MGSKFFSIVLLMVGAVTNAQQVVKTLDRLTDGVYRGVGPTDASPVGLGELELTIKDNVAHVRLATGGRIDEEDMSLNGLKMYSNGSLVEIFTGGAGDTLSPLRVFTPDEVRAGAFDAALKELQDKSNNGFPLLKAGGKTVSE